MAFTFAIEQLVLHAELGEYLLQPPVLTLSLTPETRAKRNTGQSDESRTKWWESLRAVAATDDGREVLMGVVDASTSPVVQARRLLSRAVNQYHRFAAGHPELFG